MTDGAEFLGVNRHGNLSAVHLSKRAIANIVKRAAEVAELGHSLHSGHCTSASRTGISERVLMLQTGH